MAAAVTVPPWERYTLSVEEAAAYYHTVIVNDMAAVRIEADALELITDNSYWPFPTYSDILFY